MKDFLEEFKSLPSSFSRYSVYGRVTGIKGQNVIATIPCISLGDYCHIELREGGVITAQVTAFEGNNYKLSPVESLAGIAYGDVVRPLGARCMRAVPRNTLGCVLNADGSPINHSTNNTTLDISIDSPPPSPLVRGATRIPFCTGITSIDALNTVGLGQRIAIFAEAGVGKSTLLGMLTRNAQCDVCIIALIGERGREVKEFVHDILGNEGMQKTTVVASTSDEPPMRRKMAALLATGLAEHYANQGKSVLLLVDSLTRYARSVRDIGLASGEFPIRQGYTSTVYSELPRLIERAGSRQIGSITAFYTVLTNGVGDIDPLADEIKSLVDGHIYLSDALASRGIRPAIDIIRSLSRLNDRFHDASYLKQQKFLRASIERVARDKDLLLLGGTADEELQRAIEIEKQLFQVLTQHPNELRSFDQSKTLIEKIRTSQN